MTTPALPALNEIQANALTCFDPEHAAYFFFSIEQGALFRKFLRESRELMTTELQAQQAGRRFLVLIGFTHAGLRAIGIHRSELEELPEAFSEGMAQRAAVIGDAGSSAPEWWEGPFGSGAIHGVIAILSKDPDARQIDDVWTKHVLGRRGTSAPPGTSVIWKCRGSTRHRDGYAVEPFGFRDGVSQPAIAGVSRAPDAIALGEFILGHDDESTPRQGPGIPPSNRGELLLNGTYLVFRKIRQDVAAFRRAFPTADPSASRRAAEIVGRWPNGMPLADDRPMAPPLAELRDDFGYASGEIGRYTPRQSHIRRANPRSGPDHDPGLVRRHRIVRRSIPYQDANGDEGLLFVCLQARIDDQFEFIQAQWLNNGNAAELRSDQRDAIASPDPAPGPQFQSFVRVRGGEYFFMPSRPALQAIAESRLRKPKDLEARRFVSGRRRMNPTPEGFDLLAPPPAAKLLKADALSTHDPDRVRCVHFVGRHSHVLAVLEDQARFARWPYREGVGEFLAACEGMLAAARTPGSPATPAPRAPSGAGQPESALLGAVASPEDEIWISRAAEGFFAGWEARSHASAQDGRPVDLIGEWATPLPLLLLPKYLGLEPDSSGIPSQLMIAAYFGRRSYAGIPKGWRDALESRFAREHEQDPRAIGRLNLIFWVRLLYAELFANPHRASEVTGFAALAAGEFVTHLEKIVQQHATPEASSVLGRARALGMPGEAVLRLCMNLLVAGIETTARAILQIGELLLDEPAARATVSAALRSGDPDSLDRVILEALRLRPVAPLLPRVCGAKPAAVGQVQVAPGELVLLVPEAAASDSDAFAAPGQFSEEHFRRPRTAGTLELAFGPGTQVVDVSLVVLPQIRAFLRWLLGERGAAGPAFPNLRRAGGPRGQRKRSGLNESLLVRLD